MSLNPYAPPTTPELEAQATVEDVTWFSPGQVGWATFFGTPIAAGLLLRANARAAADDQAAKLAVAGGSVATVLLLMLAFVLPDRFPSSLLSVLPALGAHALAKLQWSQRMQAHGAPRVQATGRAVKLTLASMALVIVLVLAVVIVGITLFPDAAIWEE